MLFTVFQPTALNYQGPDHGTQYRIAVFYDSDEQKKVTEAYIKQLTDAKVFDEPIVVSLEPLGEGFFPGRGVSPGLRRASSGRSVRRAVVGAEGGEAAGEVSGAAEEVKMIRPSGVLTI